MNTKTMRRRGTAAALTGAMLAGAAAIAFFSTEATFDGDVTGGTIAITANGDSEHSVTFGELFPVPIRPGETQSDAILDNTGAAQSSGIVTLANTSDVAVDLVATAGTEVANIWVAVCDGQLDATCVMAPAADLDASLGSVAAGQSIDKTLYVWLADNGQDQTGFTGGTVTFTFEARTQ